MDASVFRISSPAYRDVHALAARLQTDGAASFVKSWQSLMAVIASKSAAITATM